MERIAHRTSPTDIGLALLSTLGAVDLGYVTPRRCAERLEQTFETMLRLERFRGHLYNWYDTVTLAPLAPLYVSTVDSGNLVGLLIPLRAGLAELGYAAVLPPAALGGLLDTAHELAVAVAQTGRDGDESTYVSPSIAAQIASLEALLAAPAPTFAARHAALAGAAAAIAQISADLRANGDTEVQWWAQALERQSTTSTSTSTNSSGGGPALPATTRSGTVSRPQALTMLPRSWPRSRPATMMRPADSYSGAPRGSPSIHRSPPRAPDGIGCRECRRRRPDDDSGSGCGVQPPTPGACWISSSAWGSTPPRSSEIDTSFLFDPTRDLLTIGFNVSELRRDTSFYDLLASEARLASFVGIADGELPQEHWFALGRQLTSSAGGPLLLSWSGSMFEYLMPLLVMPSYPETLLDQTCRAAVRRQIEYGRLRGVPWGISESGYNLTDANLNYQYRAFGVPGLGLQARSRRGSRRRAVCDRAGPTGPAVRGDGEPPGHGDCGLRRPVRLLRGRRLHAVAARERPEGRGRPVVHVPPPGDGAPLAPRRPATSAPCSGGS